MLRHAARRMTYLGRISFPKIVFGPQPKFITHLDRDAKSFREVKILCEISRVAKFIENTAGKNISILN